MKLTHIMKKFSISPLEAAAFDRLSGQAVAYRHPDGTRYNLDDYTERSLNGVAAQVSRWYDVDPGFIEGYYKLIKEAEKDSLEDNFLQAYQ